MAQNVKDSPAKAIRALAERYLLADSEGAGPAAAEAAKKSQAGGCCAPAESAETGPAKSSGCC